MLKRRAYTCVEFVKELTKWGRGVTEKHRFTRRALTKKMACKGMARVRGQRGLVDEVRGEFCEISLAPLMDDGVGFSIVNRHKTVRKSLTRRMEYKKL